jgi:hypothetical protein
MVPFVVEGERSLDSDQAAIQCLFTYSLCQHHELLFCNNSQEHNCSGFHVDNRSGDGLLPSYAMWYFYFIYTVNFSN